MSQRSFITNQLKRINEYVEEAKKLKTAKLVSNISIIKDEMALVVNEDNLEIEVYLLHNGLWRKKMILGYPERVKPDSAKIENNKIKIEYTKKNGFGGGELIEICVDKEEKETYFKRTIIIANNSKTGKAINGKIICRYFPEAPLSDFTYVSYKWMDRKVNLGKYHDPGKGYTGSRSNNQLFYNYSGGQYLGTAYLDTSKNFISDLEKDRVKLYQYFALEKNIKIASGEKIEFEYVIFVGKGNENHIGHLSNVLWRLNWQKDPSIYIPQTDIRDLRKKVMSTWERKVQSEYGSHDHFGAHFLTDLFGQFLEGTYILDQFGCSWLDYDMLKANHYYEEYILTGDKKYKEYAANIINFYAYHHYVGNSKLTYPFHTSKIMKDIVPFCEKTGWGAPLEPEHIDSLGTAEMIYSLLELYTLDKNLFISNYPEEIINDVLSLQLENGHFRRLYDSNLNPVDKPGWVNQYSETQVWVPALVKLWKLTGDKRVYEAAIKTGKILWMDIQNLGLFSMGGCETDYPDYYDVDGYRTMLWAFLELYETTKDKFWAKCAERVQLFGNTMMMGYNTPIEKGVFYRRINWKPRGMIATSYYSYPDYIRAECTATGNQSVNWVAYLIMKLYDITSKKIYADRAVTAMRQVSVYRDEESVRNCKNSKDILYTIMENHCQMDDEAGLYEEGIAQDSYSSIFDLMLFQYEMMREYGGISVRTEKDKRHVIGIDCVDIIDYAFGKGIIKFNVKNLLSRAHQTTLKVFGLKKDVFYILVIDGKEMKFYGKDLMKKRGLPEINFLSEETKTIEIKQKRGKELCQI